MIIEPPFAKSVAVLDSDRSNLENSRRLLGQMGHVPVLFESAAELFAALLKGARFDLLMLALKDKVAIESWSVVCDKLGLPTILLLRDAQWEILRSIRGDIFAQDEVIKLDSSGLTMLELEWRMHALLRRRRLLAEIPSFSQEKMTWGHYEFSISSHTVRCRGQEIHLPSRQFSLALEIFRNVGIILSRDWLWKNAWKIEFSRNGSRVLDTYIAHLRKKLMLCHDNGFVMQAVYRQGYQLIATDQCIALPANADRVAR
ncbi:DNA-binding response OmpR family regulator [Variovorax boronicumulans]|uniref:winged helix-turn-helix domain-containing protein n=1 Tax=Variovorax boronicumulans TaxID=436515 RepID=UPI0027866D3F|nr:winged helix-turn-helix domain-containing protein [Variovorax boronicumulans]MDP9919083.1 DNA-binding response OmpR family regulator [Variovorax boronicumulans]